VEAKKGKPAAGCFTQSYTTQLVVAAVEEGLRLGWIQNDEDAVTEALKAFLRDSGRKFYKLKESSDEQRQRKIVLERKGEKIQTSIKNKTGTIEVVHFRSGEEIWSLNWK
jgi:dihydroorotase